MSHRWGILWEMLRLYLLFFSWNHKMGWVERNMKDHLERCGKRSCRWRLRKVEPIPSLLMLCPSQNTEQKQHNAFNILQHFNAALRCEKFSSSNHLFSQGLITTKFRHWKKKKRVHWLALSPQLPELFVLFDSLF